jgi:uncharacterized membrane protein
MKIDKNTATKETRREQITSLFDRENLLWMLGATVLIILGFVLMAGGRSEDPNVFDPNEVYSTRRITIAPIIILAGLVLLIVAIFRQPKHR